MTELKANSKLSKLKRRSLCTPVKVIDKVEAAGVDYHKLEKALTFHS